MLKNVGQGWLHLCLRQIVSGFSHGLAIRMKRVA